MYLPEPSMEASSVNEYNARTEDHLYYGKRRRQKDFCFYCEELVQCFARHIVRNHRSEIEVQRVLSYPPKNPNRKKVISQIRKKGNYIYAESTQKAVKKSLLGTELIPCSDCFGFYTKIQLWRHRKRCINKTKNSQVDSQNFLIRGIKIDQELKNKVFPRMRPDIVSMTAKLDPLVCAFGARYLKIHREAHFINVVSRKMREIGRLILEVQKLKPDLTDLFKILQPVNFDIIVEATKTIAKYDATKQQYMSPTYAMNIGTTLKQCCDIAILQALKKKDVYAHVSTAEKEAELKTLILLINENWKFEISSQAGSDLNLQKWNKISIIPLATDLQILKKYLIEKGNAAAANMESASANIKFYKILIETVYCRVILLNRRRPGELQRLLVNSYASLLSSSTQNYEEFEEAITPTEKILMKNFKRLVIRGKRGRGVPILFSDDVQIHIDLLLMNRSKFVNGANPYLFPNVNSLEPISGYRVLKNYAYACGAKNPEGITCTKLRKHLATLSQVFNMCESDLEQLATFMGHTLGIHRQAYRLPDDVYQTSKIAKILLLMENGSVGKYKGKTLDEINIDMDEDLLTDTIKGNDLDLNIEPINANDKQIEYLNTKETEAKVGSEDVKKGKCPKKGRVLVKWTPEQKKVITDFFADHIKKKRPPKKAECEVVIENNKELLKSKDWLKIKVYIQNKYTGKCK